MANNLQTGFTAFSNTHTSEKNNTGTDSCKNVVVIHHKDTLGRPLPRGLLVNVYDSTGKIHEGVIDRNGKSYHGGNPFGDGKGGITPQVRCGEIFWQLRRTSSKIYSASQPEDEKVNLGRCEADIDRKLSESSEAFEKSSSDGYVLIEAEADGNLVKNKSPQFQLSNPLKIEAHWQNGSPMCHISATYLPPPMLLNLRFLQQCDDKLSLKYIKSLIEQIRLDGGTTTLFIHGYNVPLGKTGRFPVYEETVKTGEVGPKTPKSPYLHSVRTDEMQIPWLHYDREDLVRIIKGKGDSRLTRKNYKEKNKTFNGMEALSWFPNVEYYLNLAASGKEKLDKFQDWEKYSRIIGVTWSGSVASELTFFLAELYANEAGRELAKALKVLLDEGIKVNILTHSLGARVALSALNVLGDFDGAYDESIENLIMWEPAVADNAFTNQYYRELNPIAMEIFPYAHKAAKQITVLYSTEDGVVDGDTKWGDGEISGIFGGAYPKKYSAFFGMLTKSTKPIQDYYNTGSDNPVWAEFLNVKQLRRDLHCDHPGGDRDVDPRCFSIKVDKSKIRKLIEAEADRLSADNGISDEMFYLRPWSCFRRFNRQDPMQKAILEHIIDILVYVVGNYWQAKNLDIRPPLGARGDLYTVQGLNEHGKPLNEKDKNKYYDEFIKNKRKEEKIHFFPQTIKDDKDRDIPYFISHSAMREWEYEWEGMLKRNKVFPTIYAESYKKWIIDRINLNSKFGRY